MGNSSVPLVFDSKEQKGELFYEASFHPAMIQPTKTEKKSQGREEKIVETSKTAKDIDIFGYSTFSYMYTRKRDILTFYTK